MSRIGSHKWMWLNGISMKILCEHFSLSFRALSSYNMRKDDGLPTFSQLFLFLFLLFLYVHFFQSFRLSNLTRKNVLYMLFCDVRVFVSARETKCPPRYIVFLQQSKFLWFLQPLLLDTHHLPHTKIKVKSQKIVQIHTLWNIKLTQNYVRAMDEQIQIVVCCDTKQRQRQQQRHSATSRWYRQLSWFWFANG